MGIYCGNVYTNTTEITELKWCLFPGVVSRVSKVEIVQDSLEEAEEEFEVHLVSPVGAVLKDNSKATIFIKDING